MQNNSIDELVKEGVISKRSKYNYLRKLKNVGIQTNSFLEEEIDFEAFEDFFGYYSDIEKLITFTQEKNVMDLTK